VSPPAPANSPAPRRAPSAAALTAVARQEPLPSPLDDSSRMWETLARRPARPGPDGREGRPPQRPPFRPPVTPGAEPVPAPQPATRPHRAS
jgi:hypothetical protein